VILLRVKTRVFYSSKTYVIYLSFPDDEFDGVRCVQMHGSKSEAAGHATRSVGIVVVEQDEN